MLETGDAAGAPGDVVAAVGPSGSSAGGMMTMAAGEAGAEGQGGAVRLASAQGSTGGGAMFFGGAGSAGAGGDISLAAGPTIAPKSEAGAVRMSAGTSTTETGSGGSVRLSSGSGALSGSIQVQPGFGGTSGNFVASSATEISSLLLHDEAIALASPTLASLAASTAFHATERMGFTVTGDSQPDVRLHFDNTRR